MRGFRFNMSGVVLLLAVAFPALHAIAAPIRYGSGDPVPDPALRKSIERIARTEQMPETLSKIQAELIEAGYLGAKVEQWNDTIMISAQRLYEIGDVCLTVVYDKGGIEKIAHNNYTDRVASKDQIESLKQEVINDFQDRGYYFASLNADNIVIGEGLVDFRFKIITGPPVHISRVRFRGLSRTKPEFAQKLSGIRPGDLLTVSAVESASGRIESANFIRVDSVPELIPNESYDEVEIVFYVTERKSNRLEFGGGYLPSQGELKGEIVGRLDFRSVNLFGSGRKFELLLDRKDRASSHVEMLFAQPLFIPDHLELMLHLKQIDYDSSYYSFTAEAGLTLFTGERTTLTGKAGWSRIEPQRSSQPASRSISGNAAYVTDNFDYDINPSSGKKIIFEFSYIRRTSRPDTAATSLVDDETIFAIGADSYLRLFRDMIFRLNLLSRIRVTPRELIDFSEQFKLGGSGSLRGYRQDQFAGRRLFLGQSELRLRPSRRLALYVFGDVGIIYAKKYVPPAGITTETLTRFGSGPGLFVGSETAHMTLEIGWGRGDRIGDGKIHLGLTTLF